MPAFGRLIKPRRKPPVISSKNANPEFAYRHPYEAARKPGGEFGTLYVQNVYQMDDVTGGKGPRLETGEVKSLAIMENIYKSDLSTEPVWGGKPLVGRGTMHVRRLIGTVPVEADGSAYFIAPALRSISFNALDSQGRMLMRMGSDMHIMPGEHRGCVGCHDRRQASSPVASIKTISLQRAPSVPQQPDWATNGIIDFVKIVQPVLDKHCVECHSGPTPDGAVDLSGDKTRFFNMAYEHLLERELVNSVVPNSVHELQGAPSCCSAASWDEST